MRFTQMKTDRAHPTGVTGHVGPSRKPKRVSALIGAAVVAIFALAACTAPAQPDQATPPAASVGPSVTVTPTASSKSSHESAPNFQITVYQGQDLLGGQEVEFADLLGQGKPVVLNFWAGLCPPCRLEMPDFQELSTEYNEEILLVGVDIGAFIGLGTQDDARALLNELGVTYPVGTTSDVKVIRTYQVIGMPTTFFIKPNGEIHQKWTGLLTKDKLEELVESLLDASGHSYDSS